MHCGPRGVCVILPSTSNPVSYKSSFELKVRVVRRLDKL